MIGVEVMTNELMVLLEQRANLDALFENGHLTDQQYEDALAELESKIKIAESK